MGLVDTAGSPELENAPLSGRELPQQGERVHAGEIIHKKPVLETTGCDGDTIERELFHKGVKNGCSGNDDIGPLRVYPGNFPALFQGERTEQVDDFSQVLVTQYL